MGTPSCETLADNAASCRLNLAGLSDPRSCGIPLPAPKRLQKKPGPGNGRTRTVRPCSGQLLHVHEPRTMNSLAADSLLAHPRDGSQRRKPHGLARRLRRKTRQRGGQARAGPAVSPGCAVFAKAGFLCDNKRHPFRGINGRLAQRERRCLTSTRSQVQILYRPPSKPQVRLFRLTFSFFRATRGL